LWEETSAIRVAVPDAPASHARNRQSGAPPFICRHLGVDLALPSPGLGVGVVTEGFDERLGFGLYSLSPVTPTPSLHCLPIYPSDAINRPDRRKQKKPRVREVECAGQELSLSQSSALPADLWRP
jgi:hypothetical protein